MNLAFCLGFRNWYLRHLQRCLESLRTGDARAPILVSILDDKDFHLVTDIADPIVMAAPERQLIVPLMLPYPEWSRSWALNRAADCARRMYPDVTHYVFTDADMIFPSRWFGVARAATLSAPHTLWLTRSRDLAPSTNWVDYHRLFPHRRDGWLLDHSTPHGNDLGQGGAMVVPRAWFDRVGGFDEAYRVWGCEDNDLTLRAEWDGQPVQWLPNAWVAHQWHDRTASPEQWGQVRRNRDYLAQRMLERGPIVRNGAHVHHPEEGS